MGNRFEKDEEKDNEMKMNRKREAVRQTEDRKRAKREKGRYIW